MEIRIRKPEIYREDVVYAEGTEGHEKGLPDENRYVRWNRYVGWNRWRGPYRFGGWNGEIM